MIRFETNVIIFIAKGLFNQKMEINTNSDYFSVLKSALLLCAHIGVLYMIYQLLFLLGFIKGIDVFFFKQWDASFYSDIAENGYRFWKKECSNVAFFPLFPYIWKILWKITGTGVIGICLYNMFMLFAGMYILKRAFEFSWAYFLFFISLPSNMFMYVPYSEATFFFFSSLIIAGFKMNKRRMILAGFFLASFARPSCAFFIPAIITMEIIAFKNVRDFTKNVLLYSFFPILAMLLTFLFQYKETGVWLAFFKDGWRREITFPEFPLTTWGGLEKLWIDGLALFFGILSAVILLIALLRKLRKPTEFIYQREEILSFCYILMALVTILAFGGKDQDGGSSLLSLNRFLMATPFFTVFLYYLSHRVEINFKTCTIYIGLALLALSVLNFNGTGYTEYRVMDKVHYAVLLFAGMMLFLLASKKFNDRYIAMLYAINVFVQVILIYQFSHGKWVG